MAAVPSPPPPPPPSTSPEEEPSLLCLILITERRGALASDCESARRPPLQRDDRTGSEEGRRRSGCRKEWEAEKIGNEQTGGSVNEVNGKNGKGENQSGEREEMGAAGLEIVRQKKGCLGLGGWLEGSRVWREKERAIRVC